MNEEMAQLWLDVLVMAELNGVDIGAEVGHKMKEMETRGRFGT